MINRRYFNIHYLPRHFSYLLFIFFICAIYAPIINAGGIDDKDFSLRFPAALSRFSTYGDVAAMGGASAGSKWRSSANPASTTLLEKEWNSSISISPQYSTIFFENGTSFQISVMSLTYMDEKIGSIQATYAKSWTNKDESYDGLVYDNDISLVQLQWGNWLLKNLAIGINLNFSQSEMKADLSSLRLSESESDSYGLKVGSLYRVIDSLFFGIVLDYAQSDDSNKVFDVFQIGFNQFVNSDTTKKFIATTGISYEFLPKSYAYIDYQLIDFKNYTGDLTLHRVFSGIEYQLFKGFYSRAGFAIDNEWNKSWTCGLGFYPNKFLSIDIAYQYEMFPEIETEFGKSQSVEISFGIEF